MNHTLDYRQIASFPTTLDSIEEQAKGTGAVRWHESVLRAYQILAKVKWLLEEGTKPEIILELIHLMEFGWIPEKEGEK